MSTSNQLLAKVMGDILAEGMSISGFDLKKEVKSEAIDALSEIRGAVYENAADKDRIKRIEDIMKKYRVI